MMTEQEARIRLHQHHVGMSRYKTREAFVEESKRLGVVRRVPANMLGSLSWGDKVWLAEWLGAGGILTIKEATALAAPKVGVAQLEVEVE